MKYRQAFEKQQYMNIETYRKSGAAVRTPVWFVEVDGELCFTTEAGSGKVKRLRINQLVKVAPCRVNGELVGDWYPARARFMSSDETGPAKKAFTRKYGIVKLFFDLMGAFRKSERVFIALKVNE